MRVTKSRRTRAPFAALHSGSGRSLSRALGPRAPLPGRNHAPSQRPAPPRKSPLDVRGPSTPGSASRPVGSHLGRAPPGIADEAEEGRLQQLHHQERPAHLQQGHLRGGRGTRGVVSSEPPGMLGPTRSAPSSPRTHAGEGEGALGQGPHRHIGAVEATKVLEERRLRVGRQHGGQKLHVWG